MQQQTKHLMVAQLGARHHYAIPRILHQADRLEHLYTDLCAVKGLPQILQLIPQKLQSPSIARLTGRVPHGVPTNKITAFTKLGFEYTQRLRKANSASEQTQVFLWANSTFNQLVLKQGLQGDGVYTFNAAGLEILTTAKQRGLKTIMEQTIAPNAIEYQLLQEEQELHPGWEEPMPYDAYRSQYIEREQQEWEQANIILCGSEFVRDGIQKCGGPVSRCVVVPYGVDTRFHVPTRIRYQEPLRVLTVGTVGLRKGIPYVLEAAKRLKGLATFRVVGPTQISAKAIAMLQEHVELLGQVPRSQITEHYDWADVFLLPSICEGSAGVTYEALACGLPVIATPNTGSIVRDGVDGYIVPIRDCDRLVDRLETLRTSPNRLHQMQQAAIEQANVCNFSSYTERLLQVL